MSYICTVVSKRQGNVWTMWGDSCQYDEDSTNCMVILFNGDNQARRLVAGVGGAFANKVYVVSIKCNRTAPKFFCGFTTLETWLKLCLYT